MRQAFNDSAVSPTPVSHDFVGVVYTRRGTGSHHSAVYLPWSFDFVETATVRLPIVGDSFESWLFTVTLRQEVLHSFK